jgi:hypothetical protein
VVEDRTLRTAGRRYDVFQKGLAGRFQICALIMMTEILRATVVMQQQGKRTLLATALLLSTRHTENKILKGREKTLIWEIVHGIARSNKSMRGMRLSLVSPLESRVCLLP